ncbi:MAG: DNA-3-methyladenine glycosylase 2 family protein, partial [Acidobacteria bacterium]|nr:DNA-3-methyladenine glycosylase 2 family protein [Acidobacteriota bacterium]
MPIERLTETSLLAAVKRLARRDPHLGQILRSHGAPPLWARDPGYETLALMILEQQVSLASARAAFERLIERLGVLTPERFLELDDSMLRAIGFSRQKARYVRLLSQAVLDRSFDPASLTDLDDDGARSLLTSLTGIGAWTAEVYLLMALRRPDVWPTGDRALVVAAREIKGLDHDPTPEELEILGESWRPWRAVAARRPCRSCPRRPCRRCAPA